MSLDERSPNIYRQLHVHVCLHTINSAMVIRTAATRIARATLAIKKDVFLGNKKTTKHRKLAKRSNTNLAKRYILFFFLWLAHHSMLAICLWPEYCRAWDSFEAANF